MEEVERPSNGGKFDYDASGSATLDNFEESQPLPFPQRFPGHSHLSYHEERFPVTNYEGSSGIADDSSSCLVVATMFSFFVAMTLAFGVYAPETLRLGPNTSILLNPNRFFVESIQVVELDAANGSILYGFYQNPPLNVVVTWHEIHKITLPSSTHKEWLRYLNKGSQLNIAYRVNSLGSSSLVIVIGLGNEDLAAWLENPLYPNTTFSWNIIYGNGSIQKDVRESSTYYIAVGNLNFEVVEVHLNITIKAYLYNTTESYYKCTPALGQCSFQLHFLDGNTAILTSPGRESGMVGGEWHVRLSYSPRWITYLLGTGGLTILVLLINQIFYHVRRREQNTRQDQLGVGSERDPLLSSKDDDLSSCDSSNALVSEDEQHLEDAQAQGVWNGNPIKDEEYCQLLCAICFDAPKDSFFLPCGHCVACFACGTRIVEVSGTCPICRRHIKKARKIYTV